MRQQYEVCCHGHGHVVEAADRLCWSIHAHQQLVHRIPRFAPRRSLHQKRRVACNTAVERVGHQADVVLEPPFEALKLPSRSSGHIFPGSSLEGADGLPLSTVINRRIKRVAVLPELLEVIVERGRDFNHANTSHCFNRLAKLYKAYGKPKYGEPRISPEVRQAVVAEYVEPAVAALTMLTQRRLHEYEPWDLATSLWAAAVLRLSGSEVVDSLLVKSEQMADHFMPADAANVVWACAKMQMRPKSLLKHLVPVIVEQMQLFKPHEVAMLVWSYAKLDYHPGHDLLDAVAEHVIHNIRQFPAQETSNFLWGMARLKYHNRAALHCLEQHLLQQKNGLTSQDIANALWSCAKLGFHSNLLVEELSVLALQNLHGFKPQELTNMLYAHAVLQHQDTTFLEAVASAVTARMAEFSCQELVNVLWAFGRLKYFPSQPQCLTGMITTLVANRVSLTPQALANFVKALAKLAYRPDPLTLDLIAARSISCISEFKPAELTNLLWGYATLGVHHQALFDVAIGQIQALLTTRRPLITTQHINSVLFSCETLGFCPRELVGLAETQGIRSLRIRRHAPPTLSLPEAGPNSSYVPTPQARKHMQNGAGHSRTVNNTSVDAGSMPEQHESTTPALHSIQANGLAIKGVLSTSIQVDLPNGSTNSWAFIEFGTSHVDASPADCMVHPDLSTTTHLSAHHLSKLPHPDNSSATVNGVTHGADAPVSNGSVLVNGNGHARCGLELGSFTGGFGLVAGQGIAFRSQHASNIVPGVSSSLDAFHVNGTANGVANRAVDAVGHGAANGVDAGLVNRLGDIADIKLAEGVVNGTRRRHARTDMAAR